MIKQQQTTQLQTASFTEVYGNKVKVHPITDHEDPEGEKRYNSTPSLTSALDGVGGQRHPL